MKRIAMIMVVILGTVSSIAPHSVFNPTLADTIVNSPSRSMPAVDETLTKRDVFEINFTVRTFLWALDQNRTSVLVKMASPQMRAEFPGPIAMMMVMRRIHAPVIGAKNVFLHLPVHKGGFVFQSVYLDDANGNPWKATYMLQKVTYGQFGVFGCVVKKLEGEFS